MEERRKKLQESERERESNFLIFSSFVDVSGCSPSPPLISHHPLEETDIGRERKRGCEEEEVEEEEDLENLLLLQL